MWLEDAFWTVVLARTLESPLDCKKIQPVHSEGDQSRVFIGRTDVEAETPTLLATLCEELTHLKRPWCWERLKAGGEGADRGWDGRLASPTQWTWVWVDSGSWWWTGRPGVLRFMGSQRVRHDWVTELNWTENKSRDMSSSWVRGLSIVKMSILPKLIYRFLATPIKIKVFIFLNEIDKIFLKSHWNAKGLVYKKQLWKQMAGG